MGSRTRIVILTVLALLGVAAMAVSAQLPFSYGVIQSSCAPWDGPAVEITLTTEPTQCGRTSAPYLAIGVWRGLPIRAGQTVKFGAGSDAGFASRCAKVGDCERAESGTVVFERYQEGASAAGRYELHFKGGETRKGTFDVKWCETRMICG
jgi:hypothetical protein